jgi:hypothetical protein
MSGLCLVTGPNESMLIPNSLVEVKYDSQIQFRGPVAVYGLGGRCRQPVPTCLSCSRLGGATISVRIYELNEHLNKLYKSFFFCNHAQLMIRVTIPCEFLAYPQLALGFVVLFTLLVFLQV